MSAISFRGSFPQKTPDLVNLPQKIPRQVGWQLPYQRASECQLSRASSPDLVNLPQYPLFEIKQ
jgi:hypothetical protein